MRITFLGAARTVTGSQYLLDLPDVSLLVDCGLYQGRDAELAAGLGKFAFNPRDLDHVILTHAHIDHCGLLPRLWKLGFRGKIFATSATVDLCEALLADSAKIQQEDAAWELRKWRKGQQATPPPAPLYTFEDAEGVMEHFVRVDYDDEVQIAEGVAARWVDAGHILGAASVEIWADEGDVQRKIVFSGDIGNPGRPILRDPTYIQSADLVVMESTYGDRAHAPVEEMQKQLAHWINKAASANGQVIVPSFAVGRTQELLYRLDKLLAAKEIPEIPVYVDSPLASRATRVFEKHPECYDSEALEALARGDDPIGFPSLRFTRSADESRKLNRLREPAVIISASGMCTGGRIRHHLHHHIEHGNDVILFVGYQVEGTLGRLLVDGVPRVKLFGRKHRVRARIASMRGLSAHADQKGLLQWAQTIKGPRTVFVTHGEDVPALTLARLLDRETGLRTCVPKMRDEVDLLAEDQLASLHDSTKAEWRRLERRKTD